MRRSTVIVLLAVLAILAVALALEPVLGIGRYTYVASLAATFAGVLGGVPLALLVDRQRQDQEGRVRAAQDAQAAADAREAEARLMSDVLGLIRSELAVDEAMLDVRTNTPWEVKPPFLGLEVWRAMSASGAMMGISPALLRRVARAYQHIEATSLVEREVFRLGLDPMVQTIQWSSVEAAGAGPSPLRAARNVLTSSDGSTRKAIQEAIQSIDALTDSGDTHGSAQMDMTGGRE